MSARLPIFDDTFLLILTGAGISADSGIPTFRAAGGLWNDHRVEDVASPDGFLRDPRLVWQFYSERRRDVLTAKPNAAHHALAAVEDRLGDRFLLVTQNVDGLHAAAGSQRLIEIHGSLLRSRCTVCDRPAFADLDVYRPGVVPMCGRCQAGGKDALLRPDVVWFGEALPDGAMARIQAFLAGARARRLQFVAIGTSGRVWPAAGLVDSVRGHGGATWLVNEEPSANADSFHRVVLGKASEVVPALLA